MLLFWFLFAHHGEGKKKPQHWICPIVMELSESVTRGEQARNKKERQKGDEKKKKEGLPATCRAIRPAPGSQQGAPRAALRDGEWDERAESR